MDKLQASKKDNVFEPPTPQHSHQAMSFELLTEQGVESGVAEERTLSRSPVKKNARNPLPSAAAAAAAAVVLTPRLGHDRVHVGRYRFDARDLNRNRATKKRA